MTALNTEAYCSIEDCDRAPRARGWCHMHYQRWQNHGDPTFKVKPWKPSRKRERKSTTSYKTTHQLLRMDLGSPRQYLCIDCETASASDWSLSPMTPEERINTDERGKRWSSDCNDYDPRCRSCHLRYDLFRKRSSVA